MKIAAIVTARMASRRFPGKVLLTLAGKPLIDHVIDRALRLQTASQVLVATSDEPSDDELAVHCRARRVTVFRGSNGNLAGRMLACTDQHGVDIFARIDGCNPLFDVDQIDQAVGTVVRDEFDAVVNESARNDEAATQTEVYRTRSFRHAYRRMTQASDYENFADFFRVRAGSLRVMLAGAPVASTVAVPRSVICRRDLDDLQQVASQLKTSVAGARFSDMVSALCSMRAMRDGRLMGATHAGGN